MNEQMVMRFDKPDMGRVLALVNTSVDDCKCSLNFIDDLDLLRECLRMSEERGHTTRSKLFTSRIRKIEKGIK